MKVSLGFVYRVTGLASHPCHCCQKNPDRILGLRWNILRILSTGIPREFLRIYRYRCNFISLLRKSSDFSFPKHLWVSFLAKSTWQSWTEQIILANILPPLNSRDSKSIANPFVGRNAMTSHSNSIKCFYSIYLYKFFTHKTYNKHGYGEKFWGKLGICNSGKIKLNYLKNVTRLLTRVC